MKTSSQRLSFMLAFIFTLTVAAVFLFIASGLVPYWQELSGTEVQKWFAGPFTRFAYMMIFVHLMSIGSIIWAFVVHRRAEQPLRTYWFIALVTLLACQGFNFTLFGANYNLALQSRMLEPEVALQTMDNWDFFHNIRTALVCVSVIAMVLISIQPTKVTVCSAKTSD